MLAQGSNGSFRVFARYLDQSGTPRVMLHQVAMGLFFAPLS